jgi:hypothetical protein
LIHRRACALVVGLLVLSGGALLGPAASAAASSPIRHVFIIVLENESASTTFGPHSAAPYLSKTLRAEGAYLPHYYATGHESNDNYIAMISGQAPNAENQADCPDFSNLVPGTIGANGQAIGVGCVYPAGVPTIANQLTAAGDSWRGYEEDMGADPSREAAECGHPSTYGRDTTESATAADEYAARHDPFVYFHSITDDTAYCDEHVVSFPPAGTAGANALTQDLRSASSTPNYSLITPDLCDDGHDSPCKNGQPGGLVSADRFLQRVVPEITGSPAFKQNGLLIVTFDEAATSDASSCCGEIPGPGSPDPGVKGPGGGDVGAVMLSPCIAPGTVSDVAYNHYSMLASIENIFGLRHLGYAALPSERYFGSDILDRPCGRPPPAPRRRCPLATGRLGGTRLGLLRLGMTRAQARRAYKHSSNRGRRYEDFFCLTPNGVRVGYASPKLIRAISRRLRHRYRGRVVWASTANDYYAVHGVVPGSSLRAARRRLHLSRAYHVGRNFWYFAPNGSSRALFKVRRGKVQEIGIAVKRLTAGRRAQRAFVRSFS